MTLRQFHLLLGAVVGGLASIVVLLVAGGDRTEPAPLSVLPTAGESDVSAARSLVLRFGRPVTQELLEPYFAIDPPTPGALSVEDAVVRFVPTAGLKPATQYRLTLRAGFQDVTGRTLRQDRQFDFTTRPARLVYSRPEAANADVLAPRNLWIASADGSGSRPLTRDRLGILFAAVAPDGDRVAFSAPSLESPDASELWVANLDGTGRRKIAGDADGAILGLSWAPRSDTIAYERRSVIGLRGELGRGRILAVRSDGGGGGLLYGRGDEAGSQPVWSPDGRRLLVADVARGGRTIVDPVGGAVTIPGAGSDSGTWSPDGQRVAFVDSDAPDDGTAFIRVADVDGRIVAELRRPNYADSAPSWSPDGRWIAVVSRDDAGETGVWLLDPTGGPSVQVALPPGERGAQLSPPVWAPGAVGLAFSRLTRVPAGVPRAGVGTPTVWELWVADGDGEHARRLPVDGLAEGWAP